MSLRKAILPVAFLLLPSLTFTAKAEDDYRFDIGAGIGTSGQIGAANSSWLWRNPGVEGHLILRYKFNPRTALTTRANIATLKGAMPPAGESSRQLLTATAVEISELAEFNFFNFGIGRTYQKMRRLSPYITAGAGFMLMKQGSTQAAFTIPLGAGLKYKATERLNIGLEFLMKKVFTKASDNLCGTLDWASSLSLSVSYEFSRRCATCNYKN